MIGKILDFCRLIRRTAHLMVGMPDYEAYVAHVKLRHPGQLALSRTDFVRKCQKRRYEGEGSPTRCC